MYKRLRKFRTVPPGVTNVVSNCAGNLKEKSHKVSRRELYALQSNRAKCRPPPVFLGLRGMRNEEAQVYLGDKVRGICGCHMASTCCTVVHMEDSHRCNTVEQNVYGQQNTCIITMLITQKCHSFIHLCGLSSTIHRLLPLSLNTVPN